MRFKGLDLNLLVAFDALLELRSVTRAAEQLHLSQAAMSAALGRLRDFFADDLLVVHGKRMYPTAFAQNLVPQVQASLRQIEGMLSTPSSFDPATSQRVFRVVASDYVTAVILVPLIKQLTRLAPRIRTEISIPGDTVLSRIENGDVDLLITPSDYVSPDLPAELLYEEQHVVAGCRSNPDLQSNISAESFLAAGHVTVAIGDQRIASFGDRELESLGTTRRVEITAASFTMVPWLLRGTRRLAVMHERLARVMAEPFDLAYCPLPFPIAPMREMVQHHFARSADAGLTWYRQQLLTVAIEHP